MVFRLGQLKLEFFYLLEVILFLDLLFKNFMVLVFNYFLHFKLFLFHFLVFRVNVDDCAFEG